MWVGVTLPTASHCARCVLGTWDSPLWGTRGKSGSPLGTILRTRATHEGKLKKQKAKYTSISKFWKSHLWWHVKMTIRKLNKQHLENCISTYPDHCLILYVKMLEFEVVAGSSATQEVGAEGLLKSRSSKQHWAIQWDPHLKKKSQSGRKL